MKNINIYEYISIIHNNPTIIVLENKLFFDDSKCWLYKLDQEDDFKYLVFEEDIKFRDLQIEILQNYK
jgi:hypothetical protein